MASSEGAGLISFYNEATIDLTGSGDFTGGSLKISRMGSKVMISNISALTFPSESNPTSTAGLIPSWARPVINQSNLSSNAATIMVQSFIASNGTLAATIRNYSGAGVNVTSLDQFNISYNV
jgi:hypothetical protein